MQRHTKAGGKSAKGQRHQTLAPPQAVRPDPALDGAIDLLVDHRQPWRPPGRGRRSAPRIDLPGISTTLKGIELSWKALHQMDGLRLC